MMANCVKKNNSFLLSFGREKSNLTVLDRFNLEISQHELYSEDSKLVDELLHELAARKIVRVGEFYDSHRHLRRRVKIFLSQ